MKGEHEEAERILHQALRLSHQSDNKKAIIYTYDLVILPGELHARRGVLTAFLDVV